MGDMNLAEKMIISASKNGADVCKFQTWSEKNLIKGLWDKDGRREIYKKAELTLNDHVFLIDICKKNKVEFLTSIFNKKDISFLKNIGLNKIKIPSHEVHNFDLINLCIENFEEIIISTGASKWEEIIKLERIEDKEKIVLLHCVSSYPCEFENINLPRIINLKEISKKVGYSGHLVGIEDAIASISMGIDYVEKHFTIDNNLSGRDNKFAILPDQLKVLSEYINNYQLMSKYKGKDLQKCELDTYNNYRGRWSSNV